jgi:nucleoside-diphosphate-sugar epimerase
MISIIGGSGFVGSCLIHRIKNDFEFQNIDKNQSPFFKKNTIIGNILNTSSIILEKNVKTVVLLAAEHKDDVSPVSLYYDVNVTGTENVLKAMDEAGINNLIFTSSVAIYGLNKINPNEKHVQDPFNHYGKSKWQAEQVIKEWYNKNPKNKSVTIIRPTVIFGERNRGNVYNLLKQISSAKFVMIGNGKNKKSMAYVSNVVAFIEDRIKEQQLGFNIYNYADKPDFSMSELVNFIEKKMNIKLLDITIPYWIGIIGGYFFDLISFLFRKKLSISSVRVKKFCATTQFDANLVHSIFKAPYSLEDGLNNTLDHEFISQKDDDILFFSE